MTRKSILINSFVISAVLAGSACSALFHDNHQLAKAPQPFKAVKTTRYSTHGLFTGTSIFLNEDSTFLLNHSYGCAGQNNITVGSYRVVDDSIELLPVPLSRLRPLYTLTLSGPRTGLKHINFSFIDKTGEAMDGMAVFPLPPNATEPKMNRTSPRYYRYHRRYMTGYGGREGQITIDTENRQSVEIPQLTSLTGKRCCFAIEDLAENVLLTLSINDPYVDYYGGTTEQKAPYFRKLHQSADTLMAGHWRLVKQQ
jgi:hypothetical protein